MATNTTTVTRKYLDDALSTLKKDLRADIDKDLSLIKIDVEKNKKYLFGNGESIGIDEKIRNIENGIQILVKLAWGVAIPVAGYYAIKIVEFLATL